MQHLSRRDAIKKVALLMGGTLALPHILSAWTDPLVGNKDPRFSGPVEDLIAEIAETIVPTTSTPGAKAAGVPQFIRKIVADCYDEPDRTRFFEGLDSVNRLARDMYAYDFVECTEDERFAVLHEVELHPDEFPVWRQLKELTVTGYFTSEIGCTQALRYDPVPGRYDGAYPYKKGDRGWAG